MKVAHCKLKLMLGPCSNTKNWFMGPSTPPVLLASIPNRSAIQAARLRHESSVSADVAGKGGVTKLDAGTATNGRP